MLLLLPTPSPLRCSTPVEQNVYLREGAPCHPEPAHSSWNPDPHDVHRDGARIEAGFRHFFHRADPEMETDCHELLVCHGNVIRCKDLDTSFPRHPDP